MKTCAAHVNHTPRHLTTEEHHVVPQAWQHLALGNESLYDKRTVTLCPTGHRNVHRHIVGLMKTGKDTLEEAIVLYRVPRARKRAEYEIACLALERWIAAGHSLAALRTADLWGEA